MPLPAGEISSKRALGCSPETPPNHDLTRFASGDKGAVDPKQGGMNPAEARTRRNSRRELRDKQFQARSAGRVLISAPRRRSRKWPALDPRSGLPGPATIQRENTGWHEHDYSIYSKASRGPEGIEHRCRSPPSRPGLMPVRLRDCAEARRET